MKVEEIVKLLENVPKDFEINIEIFNNNDGSSTDYEVLNTYCNYSERVVFLANK